MRKMSRASMMKEAKKRMKKMGILNEAIRQLDEGYVNVSYGRWGALFWADDEVQKKIEEVEKRYDSVVYLVLHNNTEMGELYAMLMVTPYKEDWKYDDENINDGIAYAYVWNKSIEEFSESGSIGFKKVPSGSIIRVS